MLLSENQKTGLMIIGFLAVIVIGVLAYKKYEGFAAVGDGRPSAVRNVAGDYEDVENSPMAYDYANIVAPAAGQIPTRPLETFAPAEIPDADQHVAGYDVDVADPKVFLWRPSMRVAQKNRQHVGADFYRGDLVIQSDPAHKGWFKSRYSEGDAMLNGYFSDMYQAKVKGVVGERHSRPLHITNEETIMDMY